MPTSLTILRHATRIVAVGTLLGPVVDAQTGAAAVEAPFIGPIAHQKFVRMTGDALGYELRPSFKGVYKRAVFETNRWGMRDRDYELKPPPGTYRIALVASSFAMGAGVPDEQTHEWLLEERLNREGPGVPRRHYEILNFAVGGYGILQNVVVTDRKVFPFSPQAVLLVIHSNEISRMTTHLMSLIQAAIPVGYPYVEQKLAEAGVKSTMEEPELRRRIGPLAPDLVRWSYRHIVEACREHNVRLVGIAFPEPREIAEKDLPAVAALASEAAVPLISLEGVYNGHPLDSVKLGRGRDDPHLNTLGHKLVADRIYELLRASDARALDLGFARQR